MVQRIALFGMILCAYWLLSVHVVGCDAAPKQEAAPTDASAAENPKGEASQESAPQEATNESVQEPLGEASPDKASEPPDTRATEASAIETPAEATREPIVVDASEPALPDQLSPEPTSEQQGETTSADTPVTAGPCQSQSPTCPPGYLCHHDVEPNVCHRQCDPSRQGQCPSSLHCLVLSSGEGICVPGTSAKLKEACNPQTICAFGLVCVLSGAGSKQGTCYQRCTLDTLQSCPTAQYCFLVHSRNGVCLDGAGGSKTEGADCQQSNECSPGMVCFTPLNQKSRCARLCDKAHPCTTPLQCRALKDAPQDAGACIQ